MDQNVTIKEYIDGVKDQQSEKMRRPGDAEREFLPIAVGDLPVSGEILSRHIPDNANHPHHIAAVAMLFDNGRQALVYRADYEPMTAVAGISVGSRATLLMDDDGLVAWSPALRDIELVKYDGQQVHELTREEFWNGARVGGKYEGQPRRSEYTWEVQHGERGVVARVPSESLHISDDVTPTNAVLAAVHVAAIERALQTHATGQDLTVPDAVLEQYPDLAKRYGVALPDRNGEAAARSAAIQKVISLTEKQDTLSSDIRSTQSDAQPSQSVMPVSADLPAETLQLQLEVEAVGDKILDRHIAAEPLMEQERADAVAALESAMTRASSDNSGHVLFATLDGVDVLATHDIKHAGSPGNPFTHEQLRQRYEEALQKRLAQLHDDKNAGVAPLEKPMDKLVEWHEVTLTEFAKRAVVTKLENHGRKWEVELPGGTRGFSDAATPSEAIADSHRQAIANVLWWHAPEHADALAEMQAAGFEGVFTTAMPSASVLADYPDLVRAYDLEYLLKSPPQAEPASQGVVPIANADSTGSIQQAANATDTQSRDQTENASAARRADSVTEPAEQPAPSSPNPPVPAPAATTPATASIPQAEPEEADGFAAGANLPPTSPADPKTIISNVLESVSYKDQSDGSVLYLVKDRPAFVDHGQQIIMHEKAREDEEAILAAILLAKEKYGSAFELTGSEAFKRRAIEIMLKYEIDVKLKNPQQDALRRELAKTKSNTPKPPEMQGANPQTRIGKPANNDQSADTATTTSTTPEDVPQGPLAADLIPVRALDWWSGQRDAIRMWAKTEDELKTDLAELGPQPSPDLVYWFDKAGKACDPPGDAENHLSNIKSEKPGFAPGSESELRTRDAMIESDVSATVVAEKENLMSDNQESKEDGPKLILRGVKKLDSGEFDTTVMLFKGKGNYLQGFVKTGGEKHQVIAHINERKPDPDTGEIKPNFLTLSEAHGNGDDTKWKQLGFGNAVNQRSDGKPVYFDEVLLKVGDDLVKARTTKHVDSDMHRKLGFQEPRQSRPKEEQKAPAEPAKPAPKAAAPAANEVAAGAKKPRRSQRAAA